MVTGSLLLLLFFNPVIFSSKMSAGHCFLEGSRSGLAFYLCSGLLRHSFSKQKSGDKISFLMKTFGWGKGEYVLVFEGV